MDGKSLVRLRWRLRGAWMWPSFVVLTVVDGVLVNLWPPLGDHASAVGGWLLGMFASLAAIVVLAPLLARGLRRLRRDMPRVVARDYAGVATTLMVSAAILAAGLLHHGTVIAERAATADATARAEAYIGVHAPARFRARPGDLDTYDLQPPNIYRVCAVDPMAAAGARDYCVIVDRAKPFAASVRYAGTEPNGVLSQGTS